MPIRGSIRPIAICICRDGDRILVTEYEENGRVYYRPVGGAIEFGERGDQAVRREFHEELGANLIDVRYLATLENIYVYDGEAGHEIVLVYDGRLGNSSLYSQETIPGTEQGQPFRAIWKRLDEFGPGKPPVFPEGLLDLIKS